MKTSLPIFSLAITAALVTPTQGQAPSGFVEQGSAAAVQPASSGNQDAEALVERVERNLDALGSFSAKVRNQVELFDHQVTGAGRYLQQGRGLRQLSRFELKSQAAEATFMLLEVSDGRSFWTYRELPGGPSLSQLDLERIESQLRAPTRVGGATRPGLPPIGGLPKLLAELRQNFQFIRSADTQLGDRRVWVIDGQWRPERLAAAVPEQRGAIEAGKTIELKKLPAHLPEHVLLYVGQADSIPYRIEYLRRGDKSNGAGQGGLLPGYHTMVTMEFFDVRVNVPIDPREFVYQPSGLTQPKGLKAIDATDAYLKSLGADVTK
jgi:hypothetical protein